MCDFCDVSTSRFERTEKGYSYAPSVFIDKESGFDDFYLVARGENDTRISIEYCPKCGRKLLDFL